MAGLDGIINKIDPGDPVDKDLYTLSESEQSSQLCMAGSLNEALTRIIRRS